VFTATAIFKAFEMEYTICGNILIKIIPRDHKVQTIEYFIFILCFFEHEITNINVNIEAAHNAICKYKDIS